MRIWVHDNRDTPFAERAFEQWAIRYFEEDLNRPLEKNEKARLARTCGCFIADDKSNESVEFSFVGDSHERVFTFSHRSSPNGVIEENVSLPGELIEDLSPRQSDGDRWLEISLRTADGNGTGQGVIRFLVANGLSIVSDIDDTIKVTHVPAGKKTVLRNTFLNEFQAAAGMRDRYQQMIADAGALRTFAFTMFRVVRGSSSMF